MALVSALLISLAAKTDELERGLKKARAEIKQTRDAVDAGAEHVPGVWGSLTGLAAGALSVRRLDAAVKDLSLSAWR